MNNDLLKNILEIEDFIVEQDVIVDNEAVYIKPLYIEKLSLYPELQKKLAKSISKQIRKLSPEVLYVVEASIIPIATLVSQDLGIPMSIIRKKRNYKHEKDEPQIYLNKDLYSKTGVLLDDAIWSGYTMHYVFSLFSELGIELPKCYFIFDFYDFANGAARLSKREKEVLEGRMSWISYEKLIEFAYSNGYISEHAYMETKKRFSK